MMPVIVITETQRPATHLRPANRASSLMTKAHSRLMSSLALSYGHRVIDGATAVQFLVKVKQLIEDLETLLIGR